MSTKDNIPPEVRAAMKRIQELPHRQAVRYFNRLPKAQRDAVRALLRAELAAQEAPQGPERGQGAS